ncbi:uncharacterized protein EV154DRAFT_462242 [Mucor mucedo]|uniref:uncharacterized protein n=1 Tax=Mucor mucedo TaxID=29922 RepID=UPI00221F1658|nr:uncharacterized protein EV154DRAFT_462242 [Mucor mucedo]KAI7892588.1 hypothetical protein EV154DRAFT_462242 [Mucor mucedo]
MIGGQVTTSRSLSESSTRGDNDNLTLNKNSSLDLEEAENQEEFENNREIYACPSNRNNKPCPRDPDFDVPSSRLERCFSRISNILDWTYSMETLFAFKTAAGFILLSLPAYLSQSVGWFTGWGGQWVANALIMWIFPMAGMFNFTVILGLLGTVIGALLSIIVWEIVRGNPYGIGILSFIMVFVPFQYMLLTSRIYSFLAIMTLFAYLMVITTGYQEAVGGALKHDSIEMAAGKRLLFVLLGILGATIVNWFPRPVTGRVELRKRISKTFYDLSMLYGIIFADILISKRVPLDQVKAFKKLTVRIQRQLKDEGTYLNLSKLEPSLKGKFPFETYYKLLIRLNNMADLVEGIAYASSSMDKTWRLGLIQVLDEEQFDYVAYILHIMRSLSTTLVTKMPLPPYMMSLKSLNDKLDAKLCAALQKHPEQLYNETFPSYCAYSIASSNFTEELIAASECVEELVGVENPEKWLNINSF